MCLFAVDFFKESPPSVCLQQLLHIVKQWFFFKGRRWDSTGEVFHYCRKLTCSEIFCQQRPSVLLCGRFNLTVMTDAMVFLLCWLVRKNRDLRMTALMISNITWRLESLPSLSSLPLLLRWPICLKMSCFSFGLESGPALWGLSASEAAWVWRWEHFEVLQDKN